MSSPTAGRNLVMPKSERLIVAVTSPAQRGFLFIGLVAHWKPLTVTVSGLVTPSRVNWPSAATTLLPSKTSLSDLKVMVGYFSTLKKPSSDTWVFQAAKPMSRDLVSD